MYNVRKILTPPLVCMRPPAEWVSRPWPMIQSEMVIFDTSPLMEKVSSRPHETLTWSNIILLPSAIVMASLPESPREVKRSSDDQIFSKWIGNLYLLYPSDIGCNEWWCCWRWSMMRRFRRLLCLVLELFGRRWWYRNWWRFGRWFWSIHLLQRRRSMNGGKGYF